MKEYFEVMKEDMQVMKEDMQDMKEDMQDMKAKFECEYKGAGCRGFGKMSST